MTTPPPLASIEVLARRVRRRRALTEGLDDLLRWALPTAVVLAALLHGLSAPHHAGSVISRWGWTVPLVLTPVVFLRRWRDAAAPRPLLRQVDRTLGTHDLLGAAWEFGRAPPDTRDDPAIQRALRRAAALAPGVDPAAVLPLARPRWTPSLLSCVVACAMMMMFRWLDTEERAGTRDAAAPDITSPRPSSALVTQDEGALDALREELRRLKRDGPVGEVARDLDALLASVQAGDVPLGEALQRLDALDAALDLSKARRELDAPLDLDALASLLADVADEVREDPEWGRSLATALSAREAEETRQLLEQLHPPGENSPESRERAVRRLAKIKNGLDRASRRAAAQPERDALERLERRLRRERPGQDDTCPPDLDPTACDLLKEQRRQEREQLDQLRRRRDQRRRTQEAIDALRRAQKEAERRLQRQGPAKSSETGGDSSDRASLEPLVDGLTEATADVGAQQRADATRGAVEDARRTLRRLGQGGANARDQAARRAQFERAARGPEASKEGDVSSTPVVVPNRGVGSADPDAPALDVSRALQPRPGAQKVGLVPSSEGGPGTAPGDEGPGSTAARDPSARGRAGVLEGREGVGPTRAEVIHDATQRGFATGDYDVVFTDYRAFAQSALQDETLPAATREAARRYFRLIQPRVAVPPDAAPSTPEPSDP